MATATLYLDTRRRRDDGTYPLKITVSHHGKVAHIPLDVHIRNDHWDRKRRMVINHPNKQFLNQSLTQKLSDVTASLMRLQASGSFGGKSITQVRDMVLADITPHEADCGDFAERWKGFTARHLNARTRELYTATWTMLGQYCQELDTISFQDITRQWLEGFDAFLISRGNKANSRSIHIRNIRAVFNDAMDAGLTVAYPFRRLVPKPEPKAKVVLSPMQLRTLFSADVPDHLHKYIDAFKLMFLLIGINTVDLLTTAKVVNGRVEYIRAKTHRPYSIKLEPEAAQIIEAWPSMNGHLISIGDNLRNYRGITSRFNAALQSVIPGVTTYTARYSWATIAASLDIPKETIARGLGHGGHSVTDIYIDFDLRKVDEANRRVIDWVMYGRK